MSRNPNAPLELAAADRSLQRQRNPGLNVWWGTLQPCRSLGCQIAAAKILTGPAGQKGLRTRLPDGAKQTPGLWWNAQSLFSLSRKTRELERTQSSSKSPFWTHRQPPSAEHYRTTSQNNYCSVPPPLDPQPHPHPRPRRWNKTHSGWSVEGCRWRRWAWRWRWWSRTVHPGVPPCPWPAGAPGTGPGSPCPCRAQPCAEYLRDRRGV